MILHKRHGAYTREDRMIHNRYQTAGGEEVGFRDKFALDVAKAAGTDASRVAVVGMSRGSVIVDTLLLPPSPDSRDQRPARHLASTLQDQLKENKARLCVLKVLVAEETVWEGLCA